MELAFATTFARVASLRPHITSIGAWPTKDAHTGTHV